MSEVDTVEVTIINGSANIALKVMYIESGDEKTLGPIGPAGRGTYARKVGSVVIIRDDDGKFINKINVSPETRDAHPAPGEPARLQITVNPPPDMLKDLPSRYKTLPNVEPVLSSYDLRSTYTDEIKRGWKARLFEKLQPDSRNYYTTDGDYAVMNGVGFNTINTNQYRSESRVVTSLHESRDAWNIGVTVSAGKPTKSKEGDDATSTKTPVGGSLSFKYREANSELRSGTAGYTFAFERSRHYELTMNAGQLALNAEFRDGVRDLLLPEVTDRTQFLTQALRVQDLIANIETIEASIVEAEHNLYNVAEDPDRALTRDFQSDIRTFNYDLAQARSAYRSAHSNLEMALATSVSGVGKFINIFGTHYAQRVMFGQAVYETTRFSRESLKKMHEAGVNVELEVKGNIKSADVGIQTEGGYQRSETSAQETGRTRIERSVVGGNDMDSAEPVEIELVPLGRLLVPEIFHEAWGADDLAKCREVLDTATEALLSEPELYPLLAELEIWEVSFRNFTNKQVHHTREVWGTIKVNRSAQQLQAYDEKLDSDPAVDGKAIWQRTDESGHRVQMMPAGEAFSREAQLPFYLIAETDSKDPELIVSWWLKDFMEAGWVQSAKEKVGRANFSDSGLLIVNNGDIETHFEARKVRFDELPDYKRLEITNCMEKKMSTEPGSPQN